MPLYPHQRRAIAALTTFSALANTAAGKTRMMSEFLSRRGYSPVSKWGYPDRTLVLISSVQPRSRRKPRKPRLGPNRSQWAALLAQRPIWPATLHIQLEASYSDHAEFERLYQNSPRS